MMRAIVDEAARQAASFLARLILAAMVTGAAIGGLLVWWLQ